MSEYTRKFGRRVKNPLLSKADSLRSELPFYLRFTVDQNTDGLERSEVPDFYGECFYEEEPE